MRYMILILETHYPDGWNDYVGTAWTIKGATKKAKDKAVVQASSLIYQIIDRITLKKVAVGKLEIGQDEWVEALGDVDGWRLRLNH